jgi:UDP-N-acetylmuramoyl-tripeptide--D-alanyl-D-alanine ligase
MDADLSLCAEALASYRPPLGRGTRQNLVLPNGKSFTLIDETFNASPVATQAAIAVLGQTPVSGQGRRIAVLGDMKELGASAQKLHEDLAINLIKNKIDVVHCCGDLMACLHEALPKPMRGHLAADSAGLAPLVTEDVREGDAIMIKGSHSVHMEKIVESLKEKISGPSLDHKQAS